MGLRKLGVVREIVESVGMEISHAYDDLVFLNHNGFLLQFDEQDDTVIVHRNKEADPASLVDALSILKEAAERHGMIFIEGTDYILSTVDEENLRIEFVVD
ncbi:MAG TPA: hypothetical protein ENK84_07280 [Desulfobulbus sp.]|nr:hypothetical protein [Desulfobulbus sp.]HHD63590.1 hypothetical protein [Desulfobulbaceae bacterium]